MNRMHFTHHYLISPTNPVTVNLIGAGGTGSQMITALARINHTLIELEHPGLQVTVWDNDIVTSANQGRQLFASSEVGLPKSICLINRTNRFFGTNWKARTELYTDKTIVVTDTQCLANITITCVDTVVARQQVAKALAPFAKASNRHHAPITINPMYWLDFGNSQKTGQAMLSTVGEIKQPDSKKYTTVANLPFITDEYGYLLQQSETDDDGPSCSLAEALQKQDLFINSTLANLGSALLWSLFRNGMTENRGVFLNLADLRSLPVKV